MRRRSLRSCTGSQNPEQRVFTDGNGEVVHPHAIYGASRRIVHNAGLPTIRFHDLRHTHATLGLDAGVPVKIISERLGHATTSFTMDVYMHAIPAAEDDAADQIADLMFGRDDEAASDGPDADEDPDGQRGGDT